MAHSVSQSIRVEKKNSKTLTACAHVKIYKYINFLECASQICVACVPKKAIAQIHVFIFYFNNKTNK